ncbi:hypothetical protein Tdes44962_MAKER05925 [Teratosphaeria destructans]|uniref:Uncharacterized protein n=1 Tax=Teratosphaeria destructans TaxID=418781 RepID=A0A9W7SIL4_9PEZI|nr:hypothetical protein Tdes44962_MAKER05925 [Teratosphaeria destructans]
MDWQEEQRVQRGVSQAWLPRAQIDPSDFTCRKVVGEIHRPEAGASADIQTSLRVVDGREDEAVAICHAEQVMLKIQAICFALVLIPRWLVRVL